MDGVLTFGSALTVLGISLIVVAGVGSTSIEFGSLKVSGLTVLHRLFLGGVGAAVLVFGLTIVWPVLWPPKPTSRPAAPTRPHGVAPPKSPASAPQPNVPAPPKRVPSAMSTATPNPSIAAVQESAEAAAARHAPTAVPFVRAFAPTIPTESAPALIVAEIDWLKLKTTMAREVRCAPQKCEGHFWLYIDNQSPAALYGAARLELTQDSGHSWKIVPRSSNSNLEFTNSCSGEFQVGRETVWKEFRASFRFLGRADDVNKYEIVDCALVDQ